jgi:hypothetical protein
MTQAGYELLSKLILPLGIGLQIGLIIFRPYRRHNKSRMSREVHAQLAPAIDAGCSERS